MFKTICSKLIVQLNKWPYKSQVNSEDALEKDTAYDVDEIEIEIGENGRDASKKEVVVLEDLGENRKRDLGYVGEPKIGMKFETAGKAFDFHNSYARNIGFGIRKDKSISSKKKKNWRTLLSKICVLQSR